jgi:hypothetical protein
MLPKFQAAYLALSEAKTVDEVKRVRDQGRAVQMYVTQQKYGMAMQNAAAQIVLRAERKAGAMLATMDRHTQAKGRPGKVSQAVTLLPTLKQLDVGRMDSSRWQAIAAIPEEAFEAYLTRGGVLSAAGLLRSVQQKESTVAFVKDEAPLDYRDIVAIVMSFIMEQVRLWPSDRSYKLLIGELRHYADCLEKRERSNTDGVNIQTT